VLSVVCFVATLLAVFRIPMAADKKKEVEPCALLTLDDAKQIAGVGLKRVDGPLGPAGKTVNCHYREENPAGRTPIEVDFNVGSAVIINGRDITWDAKRSAQSAPGRPAPETIAGIGEEAVLIHGIDYRERGLLSVTVFARTKAHHFDLLASGFKREPVAAVKEVARKIADRL
jgi:hypothetical protein